MQELRYNIFPAVNRCKECYLAVVNLKMTGNPTAAQLINAAKAKYNGLDPYNGLNAAVTAQLKCLSLSNWRILKDTDKFGGGATLTALTSAAPSIMPSPHERCTTGSEIAVAISSVGDMGDYDGDGNIPLYFTFTRGERLFQQWQKGRQVHVSGRDASHA